MLRFAFCCLLLAPLVMAQPISEKDYRAGPIVLEKLIDDILPLLGVPKEISVDDEPQTGGIANIDGRDTLIPPSKFYVYYFDSLQIRTSEGRSIQYFEFTTKAFVTARGIRVGHSLAEVRRRYGEPDNQGPAFTVDSDETGEDIEFGYYEKRYARAIWFYFAEGVVRRIAMGWFNP